MSEEKNETYLKTYLKDPRRYNTEKREVDDSKDDVLVYDNDDNYYIAIKK